MKQIFAAMAVMLLLLGCAGQQPSQQAQQQTTQQTQQQQTTQQTEQQPSANPLDELLSALGASQGWKVSYVITGSEMPNALEMTQYMKGAGKFRTDSVFEGMESRSYVIGNDVYSCTKQEGSWTCFKFSGTMSGADSYELEKGIEEDPGKYTVTADGTKQVAGVTAVCYKVVAEDTTTRYCVYDSVPLYVMSTSTSNGKQYTSEMTATSYSKSVSDADFVLPAAATEMGGGWGTTTGSGSSGGSAANGSGTERDACESACSSLSGDTRDLCVESCLASG